MKKTTFTDNQILNTLKQAENGIPVPELCREHGMAHGIRSLASTTLNEKSSELNLNPDAIEACLAHKIAVKVSKTYNHLDERRSIMQWWGIFIFHCFIN